MKAFLLSPWIVINTLTRLAQFMTKCWAIGWVVFICGLPALGQYSELGGIIKTKDLGTGALSVNYFLESSAADSHGYFQVEVTTLKGASTTQRDLEIVLYVNSSSKQPQSNVAFHFSLTLPEGATTAQTAIPIFMVGDTSAQTSHINWDIGIWEDGRDIEQTRKVETVGLTNPRDVSRSAGRPQPSHKLDRVVSQATTLHLLDDGAAPSTARALRIWLAQEIGTVNSIANASVLVAQNFDLTRDGQRVSSFRHLSSAPDLWQYYLQFRIVVVEAAVLAKSIATRPAVALALKHYVAAGGNLLLTGGPAHNGKETVDQWLLEGKQAAAQRIATWRGVEPSFDSWWARDELPYNISVATGEPVVAYQNFPSGGYGMSGSPVVRNATPKPFGFEGAPDPSASWDPRLKVARDLLRVEGSQVPRRLSVGGVARDLWTAVETYAAFKYSAMQVVETELETLIFARDLGLLELNSSAMGANVGPGSMGLTVSSDAFGMPMEWQGLSITLLDSWYGLQAFVNKVESLDTSSVALRPHVLGHIAVIEGDLTAYPIEVLTALVQGLSYSPAMATSSISDQMWTYRNLIDAVGKPPVWTFCAIVLLFGLILGPGLLIFTGWVRRRSLLIFLVPFISVVATLSIVVYEVVHEGFATSIRISSVLAVDELTGDGFAWSRQTYFSGWPPREGFTVPKDVYCRPVNTEQIFYAHHYNVQNDPHPRDSVRSHINAGRDKSHWQSALRPREQQQFLIGHPAKLTVPLSVSRTDAKHVRIRNLTQEELPFAIVRDEQQGFYVVENLAAGGVAECGLQAVEDIGGFLSRTRAEFTPKLPDGLSTLTGWTAGGFSSTDVIDRVWQRTMMEDPLQFRLPPRGFVTLLRSNDSIYVPLEGHSSENSHLVTGSLVW